MGERRAAATSLCGMGSSVCRALHRHVPGSDGSSIVSDEAQPPGSERPPTTSVKRPPFRDRLAAVLPGLSPTDRNLIRSLAVSLHELGEIQRERGEPACIASYQESLDLAEEMGERAGAAICAFNLGTAHKDIPAIRDLDRAENWYRRSLELYDERDRLRRGRSQGQLGGVALERFWEARNAGEAAATLLAHLNAARGLSAGPRVDPRGCRE